MKKPNLVTVRCRMSRYIWPGPLAPLTHNPLQCVRFFMRAAAVCSETDLERSRSRDTCRKTDVGESDEGYSSVLTKHLVTALCLFLSYYLNFGQNKRVSSSKNNINGQVIVCN